MRSRFLALAVTALLAALTGCTSNYSDGKSTKSDGTLRPGETPVASSDRR